MFKSFVVLGVFKWQICLLEVVIVIIDVNNWYYYSFYYRFIAVLGCLFFICISFLLISPCSVQIFFICRACICYFVSAYFGTQHYIENSTLLFLQKCIFNVIKSHIILHRYISFCIVAISQYLIVMIKRYHGLIYSELTFFFQLLFFNLKIILS